MDKPVYLRVCVKIPIDRNKVRNEKHSVINQFFIISFMKLKNNTFSA